jgi:LCP family protein required for cell wall assembly
MSDRPSRREPATPPPRPSRPRLRNQLLFVFGIILLAGGAFYTALVVATQIDQIFFPDSEIKIGGGLARLPLIDKSNTGEELGGGRINVLVMGLDRRPREGDAPSRTDTMFVMTVDPSTRTARGLAMPRDLFVDIPSKTGNTTFKERVNAAYVIGETQDYQGGGPALAKATVEKLLGIKIHYYVTIDFEGFREVINLIGGVDVDVPPPGVNDPFYSETELPGDYYPCVFQPGLHHMDGSDALCYSRVRRNSSDLDRIFRQQRIMFAVMDKVTELKVLADPANALNLWKRYKSTIQTDINDFQVPGFAKLIGSIDTDQMAFLSLGAVTTPYTTPQGAAVLLPSPEGIAVIVDAFMSDDRLLQEAALVEVQNGTSTNGHASKAVEYLTQLGIPQASLVAVNASGAYDRTEIIDFGGKRYTAERIAGWLSVPKNRVRQGTEADQLLRNSEADIVVILGPDAKVESALAPASSTR